MGQYYSPCLTLSFLDIILMCRGEVAAEREPTMLDSAWKVWYQNEHEHEFNSRQGNSFEDYVSKVLKLVDPEFIDPDPMGSLGDEGCDGLSGDGKTLYACYGKSSKTTQNSRDAYTAQKMEVDLTKAVKNWPDIQTWCFITNAPIGPIVAKKYTELKQHFQSDTSKRLNIQIWNSQSLWEMLCKLDDERLSQVLPPAPHAEDTKFQDVVEAIERIGNDNTHTVSESRIGEVSPQKMEYNEISPMNKIAFNEGRQLSPEIEKWFDLQTDANLYDVKARLLRKRYENLSKTCQDSDEILENLYVYVGGTDFRFDTSRKTAVYAVVSYFFDRCDIFKDPYEHKYTQTGDSDAATN